jgi:hypothetical protein
MRKTCKEGDDASARIASRTAVLLGDLIRLVRCRLVQKDVEHEEMLNALREQLTCLQQAQDALEDDFTDMRDERDQALADLQLLAEHCSTLLEERNRVMLEAPTDSEQVCCCGLQLVATSARRNISCHACTTSAQGVERLSKRICAWASSSYVLGS